MGDDLRIPRIAMTVALIILVLITISLLLRAQKDGSISDPVQYFVDTVVAFFRGMVDLVKRIVGSLKR